jgi:hypothetical protein
VAKLVPGISHRNGLSFFREMLASKSLHALGTGQPIGIQAKLNCKLSVEPDQPRLDTGVGATRAKKRSGGGHTCYRRESESSSAIPLSLASASLSQASAEATFKEMSLTSSGS